MVHRRSRELSGFVPVLAHSAAQEQPRRVSVWAFVPVIPFWNSDVLDSVFCSRAERARKNFGVPVKESPIFIKAYETMVWIMQHTAKFPKNQRFLMAKRMEEASLDFYERLNLAARRKDGGAVKSLSEADEVLANLKMYNRLCKDLKLLAFNQYEYLAAALDEIGRLLGGWKKSISRRS